MRTSIHPQPESDTGVIVPAPKELKERLVHWAPAVCKEYDFGKIIVQELVNPGYSIYNTIFYIQKPVKLYNCCYTPTVAMQYTRAGEIICRLNNQDKILLDTSHYNLFYLPTGSYSIHPPCGTSVSLRIEISGDYLKDLLSAHAPLQKMMQNLDQANNTSGVLFPAPMNGKVKNILNEIFQTRKTGPSLYLEMKAQIYRLLSAYDEEITLASYLESIQASKTSKTILAVKHHIVDSPHIHECSLECLSKLYNISVSALKVNFKKQCDISLGDFVQQQCILKAQEMVLLNIDTIRDIALELGYTDVSNFSRAFRKYLGCSPNEMRLHSEKYKNGVK